ncbi:L-rhamnose-binding lectin SML isoform X2 [Oryzias melastigma]|uniref:L-rhamnose-binding lectin SML-like n=1 Tax=Oryzias melastigma TaxID=30732 RepID=A0A3B3BS30_ORYME|nr:L-rhamnose-binding lectin SML isoform X2 [Oryzias melastigma]
MQHFSTMMLLTAVCLLMASGVSAETVVTCQSLRVHTLECRDNKVITVQSSFYGRRDRTTCSQGQYPWALASTTCYRDMLDLIKERCEFEQRCDVPMADITSVNPCFGIFKYIKTEFTCIAPQTVVACERRTAKLTCPSGKTIKVLSAYYGRRDSSVCTLNCPLVQTQNEDCENPTDLVAQQCDGTSSCTIKASNSVFGDPCPGTYKYLEASYICV